MRAILWRRRRILTFRGVGLGAREEGVRLLRLAALAGNGKAAYQVGVISLAGTASKAPDPVEAARFWEMAAKAGRPLAEIKLKALVSRGAAD